MHDYSGYQCPVGTDAAARSAGACLAGRAASKFVRLNSVTLFEALYGMALLASGQRKSILNEHLEQLLQDDLQNRMLPLDPITATNAHNGYPTAVRMDAP